MDKPWLPEKLTHLDDAMTFICQRLKKDDGKPEDWLRSRFVDNTIPAILILSNGEQLSINPCTWLGRHSQSIMSSGRAHDWMVSDVELDLLTAAYGSAEKGWVVVDREQLEHCLGSIRRIGRPATAINKAMKGLTHLRPNGVRTNDNAEALTADVNQFLTDAGESKISERTLRRALDKLNSPAKSGKTKIK